MHNEQEAVINHEGHHLRHVLFAFIGGAAAGAIAALLTAPASGAETRAKLNATRERGQEKIRHLPETLKAAMASVEEELVAALESGKAGKLLERAHKARESTPRQSVS